MLAVNIPLIFSLSFPYGFSQIILLSYLSGHICKRGISNHEFQRSVVRINWLLFPLNVLENERCCTSITVVSKAFLFCQPSLKNSICMLGIFILWTTFFLKHAFQLPV